MIVLVSVLVLGMLSIGGLWILRNRGESPPKDARQPAPVLVESTSPPPSTSTTATSTAATSTTTATVTTTVSGSESASPGSAEPSGSSSVATDEATATSQLGSLRTSGIAATNLDGTWSAQIASQYVGVEDHQLQPEPFTAVDILNLHRRLVADSRFAGRPVVMLKQNDFGKYGKTDKEIWITMVLLGHSSKDDVQSWCESTFGMTGEPLKNFCLPRQMKPLYR
ncbi:hypothetical protein IEE94_01130 [Yimella sp. cx-573]|nr:hypothetical protein [Yimella sp. cx-573]